MNENQESNAGRTAALVVTGAWLCTFFWKPHKARNGTQYPGGYDTVYTQATPAAQYEKYRAKYGDVIALTFAVQVDAEHIKIASERGDSILSA